MSEPKMSAPCYCAMTLPAWPGVQERVHNPACPFHGVSSQQDDEQTERERLAAMLESEAFYDSPLQAERKRRAASLLRSSLQPSQPAGGDLHDDSDVSGAHVTPGASALAGAPGPVQPSRPASIEVGVVQNDDKCYEVRMDVRHPEISFIPTLHSIIDWLAPEAAEQQAKDLRRALSPQPSQMDVDALARAIEAEIFSLSVMSSHEQAVERIKEIARPHLFSGAPQDVEKP